MKKIIFLIILTCLIGCYHKIESIDNQDNQNTRQQEMIHEKGDEEAVYLYINNHEYNLQLIQNETTDSFLERLPLTVTMNELNGNEKYVYLDQSLPSHGQKVYSIHTGDIMLFNNDCLVLFYEDFQTNYQYTPIGKITDTHNLKENLGKGNVQVIFQKEK